MRMWMVDPRIMCRKHLLGEHVEIHMLASSFNLGHNLNKFYEKRLIEPLSLFERHDAIVEEIERRGWKHNSPMPRVDMSDVNEQHIRTTVDIQESYLELMRRCDDCQSLIMLNNEEFKNENY